MCHGKFIAFEGIDFCGKSTQLNRVIGRLSVHSSFSSYGYGCEPNITSPLGRHIKQILRGEYPMPELFELQRLFVLDRAENIFLTYRPMLLSGRHYFLDRYALSTIAYGMLEYTAEKMIQLHYDVIGPAMLWPDVTFLIDISVQEAVRRQEERGTKIEELFEKSKVLQRVRENYLSLARRTDIGKIFIIGGERPAKAITEDILHIIKEFIPLPEEGSNSSDLIY